MAKLIYSGITSLDGYVADADGNFDWGMPDKEVHTFVNDLERSIGTYLYGRRMCEVMLAWERGRHPIRTSLLSCGLYRYLSGGRQGRVLHNT